MSLNKVMLIGNVGRDPEIRQADGGLKVASFTLATTERYKTKDGSYKDNTEWHNIVAWRGTAEVAEKYIRKGTQIYVEGRIRTRSWDDQQGNKRYTTEIVADNIQLLGKKEDSQPAQPTPQVQPRPQAQQRPQQRQTTAMPYPTVEDDGDLPF